MSWKKVKLGNLIQILSGFAFDSKRFNESNGIPIIRIRDIKRSYSETFYDGKFDNKYIVKKGDVLIGMDGEFNISEWKGIDSLLNQRVCKINSYDEKQIDKRYLAHFLPLELKYIEDKTSFVTVKHLSVKDINEIQIPLPPLATQQRIAAILDAADALRRKDQELLQKYDALAQAIFIDMFGSNENVVKLNEITTKITDGVHAKPNYQETGVPFLSVKNATNKFLDFENSKFISQADHETYIKRCKPEFEDILYTKVGATYGRAAIINSKREFSIYVSLALIKPDRSKVYPYYLNFVLNTNYVKSQADRRVKGAGVPDLHLVEIKDFDIPLPTYEEQLDFSNVIENLNKNINATKKQVIQSENLFQTLLQKSFKAASE